MNIYLQTEIDFVHNGLGFLTDVLSAKVEDNLNGDYSLIFEYKIDGKLSEYLVNENIVRCKVADGTNQLFIIKNVIKTFDSIQVTCKHIFYRLLDNFLEDVAPTNLSPQPFLKWILDRTNYTNNFTSHSDISTPKSARYVRRNPVDCILGDTDNSMANLFGGEIKRDNFDIYFNQRIGNDNGVKLIVGKNITGINITVDTNSVHTKIMPQGFDGLLLPEKYVNSPLINTYVNPKIYKVEFSDIKYNPEDETSYQTKEEAYDALRNATQDLFSAGIDKPTINVKIDWIELSKTNEYKDYANLERVSLGDTITIDLLGINYQSRIIKTIYNPLNNKIETFEIGTPKENISNSTNQMIKKIEKVNPNSILAEAKRSATEQLTKAMGGYVYKTENELYIMDTNDVTTANKVWRWNLNGLGYSKNGINGPYETAITQDGQIVANFITTGKLNTNVIEGYDELLLSVNKMVNLVQEKDSIDYLILDNAMKGRLQELVIEGPINLLYPDDNLYPSNDLYLLDSYLIIDKARNLTTEAKKVYLPVLDLKENEKLVLKPNDCYIVRQDNSVEPLDDIDIELFDGVNYIYLESFQDNNIKMSAKYAIKNSYTDMFATKVDMASSINSTAEEINLAVAQKISNNDGGVELASLIRQTAELIFLKANNFGWESNNSSMTTDGRITASAGKIGGFELNETFFHAHIKDKYTYTLEDYQRALDIANGSSATAEEKLKYDINEDGIIDRLDTLAILRKYYGYESTEGDFYLNSNNPRYFIQTSGNGTQSLSTKIGLNMLQTSNFTAQNATFQDRNDSSITTTISGGSISCVSLNQTSLKTKKKNFEIFKNALDEIKKIDIYKYNLKHENNKVKKHLGFVIGDKFNYSQVVTNNEDTSVDLYSFISLCAQAIKEQQIQMEQLESKINKLEEMIINGLQQNQLGKSAK